MDHLSAKYISSSTVAHAQTHCSWSQVPRILTGAEGTLDSTDIKKVTRLSRVNWETREARSGDPWAQSNLLSGLITKEALLARAAQGTAPRGLASGSPAQLSGDEGSAGARGLHRSPAVPCGNPAGAARELSPGGRARRAAGRSLSRASQPERYRNTPLSADRTRSRGLAASPEQPHGRRPPRTAAAVGQPTHIRAAAGAALPTPSHRVPGGASSASGAADPGTVPVPLPGWGAVLRCRGAGAADRWRRCDPVGCGERRRVPDRRGILVELGPSPSVCGGGRALPGRGEVGAAAPGWAEGGRLSRPRRCPRKCLRGERGRQRRVGSPRSPGPGRCWDSPAGRRREESGPRPVSPGQGRVADAEQLLISAAVPPPVAVR